MFLSSVGGRDIGHSLLLEDSVIFPLFSRFSPKTFLSRLSTTSLSLSLLNHLASQPLPPCLSPGAARWVALYLYPSSSLSLLSVQLCRGQRVTFQETSRAITQQDVCLLVLVVGLGRVHFSRGRRSFFQRERERRGDARFPFERRSVFLKEAFICLRERSVFPGRRSFLSLKKRKFFLRGFHFS